MYVVVTVAMVSVIDPFVYLLFRRTTHVFLCVSRCIQMYFIDVSVCGMCIDISSEYRMS